MIWLPDWPTSSGTGLVVALVLSVLSAIGSTPATLVGSLVRTMGPVPPTPSGSGGTTMLLVSAIALTSEEMDSVCVPLVASVHVAPSVMRLNCATRGFCALGAGAGVAKVAAPYQVSMRCVVVRLPRPACARVQSSQSASSFGSQVPLVLVTAAAAPSGCNAP